MADITTTTDSKSEVTPVETADSNNDDKYKNGKCPRCPGYIMMNSRTGKPFATCFKCSSRCPTKDCSGFRGKSQKGYRYSHCAKCTFKDKYTRFVPEKLLPKDLLSD